MAVDELNIQTLIHCIQKYLIELESEVIYQNSIEILEFTYQRELYADLFRICLDKVCREPEIVFSYDKLKAHIMEIILKEDNLYLEEIIVWDNLIKWCHAQHPDIPQDSTKWNEEQITIMERVINRFVPLIRFYHISSNDFFYKVLPYKKLLPKKLIYDIFEFHLSSKMDLNVNDIQLPRQMKNLVDNRHFAIFASWIDKKNSSYYKNNKLPYNFNLIYRGNQDGMDLDAFHEKCDHKEKTLVVAKIKDTEQLVGGYNPLVWEKNDKWKDGKNSFLFSFSNRKNIQTATLGNNNNKNDQKIIHSNKFGNGPDLFIGGNGIWKCVSDSYSKLDVPKEFNVDDYLVFQIIK
jgi:hypothetical protein